MGKQPHIVHSDKALAINEGLLAIPELIRRLSAIEEWQRAVSSCAIRRKSTRTIGADQLGAKISEVMALHEGAERITAKRVVRALEQRGIECRVSLRTIRRHMSIVKRKFALSLRCHR